MLIKVTYGDEVFRYAQQKLRRKLHDSRISPILSIAILGCERFEISLRYPWLRAISAHSLRLGNVQKKKYNHRNGFFKI